MFLLDSCIISRGSGKARAYAKINLTLDIKGRRPDGYHDIQTIMRSVDLYDNISVCITDTNSIKVTSDADWMPVGPDNIAYRAAELFLKTSEITCGLDIHIQKNIPSGAGMGGGSADGAAVLCILNKLFDDKFSLDKLIDMGAKIGADIPFCIVCGTALAEGIGEKLTPINTTGELPIVIIKPDVSISTKKMYDLIDKTPISKRPDTIKMKKALESGDVYAVSDRLYNVMELAAIMQHEVVGDACQDLVKAGALNAIMTGSGSAVFGVFETKQKADEVQKRLFGKYKYVYSTKML